MMLHPPCWTDPAPPSWGLDPSRQSTAAWWDCSAIRPHKPCSSYRLQSSSAWTNHKQDCHVYCCGQVGHQAIWLILFPPPCWFSSDVEWWVRPCLSKKKRRLTVCSVYCYCNILNAFGDSQGHASSLYMALSPNLFLTLSLLELKKYILPTS